MWPYSRALRSAAVLHVHKRDWHNPHLSLYSVITHQGFSCQKPGIRPCWTGCPCTPKHHAGYLGIVKKACQAKGCCWLPLVDLDDPIRGGPQLEQPACFYTNTSPSVYQATEVNRTKTSTEVSLTPMHHSYDSDTNADILGLAGILARLPSAVQQQQQSPFLANVLCKHLQPCTSAELTSIVESPTFLGLPKLFPTLPCESMCAGFPRAEAGYAPRIGT